jgi:hypothetical protein
VVFGDILVRLPSVGLRHRILLLLHSPLSKYYNLCTIYIYCSRVQSQLLFT